MTFGTEETPDELREAKPDVWRNDCRRSETTLDHFPPDGGLASDLDRAAFMPGLFTEPVAVWALRISGAGFLILALGAGVKALIRHGTSEYAVTNKRVFVKVGLIRRDSLELLLAKVEAIGVNQSVLGRLLGYGTLVITGTGGSANAYHGIGSPLNFRRRVQEQIGSVQDRP